VQGLFTPVAEIMAIISREGALLGHLSWEVKSVPMKSKMKIFGFLGMTFCLLISSRAGVAVAGVSKSVHTTRKSDVCSNFPRGYTKIENALQGSKELYAGTNSSNIEVYLSRTHASCPDDVAVYAKGNGQATVSIYRVGYYQGLGARLISKKILNVALTSKSKNIFMSHPGADGTKSVSVTANFPQVDTLHIDRSWVPGMYAIKISSKKNAGIAFLAVNQRYGDEPAILVSATNTFQAYNRFEGHSAYYNESFVLDYRRPLPIHANANFEKSESRLLYLLEKNGIDTSVTTDEAFRNNSKVFAKHKVVILPTHSEYWSQGEMDQMLRASTNHLAVLNFGANEGWWRIRFDSSYQFSSYKFAARDPIKGMQATINYLDAGITTTSLFGTSYGCVRSKGIPVTQVNNWLVKGTSWNNVAVNRGSTFFNLPALFLSQKSEIDSTKKNAPADTQYLAKGDLTDCQGGTSKYGPVKLWAISYRPASRNHGMTFNAGTEGWGFSLNDFNSSDLSLKVDSHNVEIMTMTVINRALMEEAVTG
jgi:hypothetical protein